MRRTVLTILVTAVLATACQSEPAPPVTGAARTTTLRLYMQEDYDVIHLPWLLMIEDLRAAGYTIETTDYADLNLVAAALAQGDVDFAANGYPITWSAMSEGADFVPVLEAQGNTYLVITTRDIETCADLDGRHVAVPSVSGASASMLSAYVEKYCPGSTPELLAMAGGSNRRAALLSGEIDGVVQEIDDFYLIESSAPGQFHAAVAFAEAFPGLQIGAISVRRAILEDYRESVKDFLRSMLLQRRRLQDPAVLRDEIVARLDMDAAEAQDLADLYLEYNAWPVNGEFTRETVQANLDFYQEIGAVPAELTVEQAGDWTVLEAVLNEIGRQ